MTITITKIDGTKKTFTDVSYMVYEGNFITMTIGSNQGKMIHERDIAEIDVLYKEGELDDEEDKDEPGFNWDDIIGGN